LFALDYDVKTGTKTGTKKPEMNKVTVRKRVRGNETRWQVDRMEDGKRRRTFHESKTEAEAEAKSLRAQVMGQGKVFLSLKAHDRNRLMMAWTKAHELGLDLDKLITEGTNSQPAKPSVSLADAIKALCAHSKENCSPRYVYQLGTTLNLFAKGREALPLSAVTSREITDWLRGRSQWTRSTYRNKLSALFSYALQQELIEKNPLLKVAGVRIKATPPNFLTVQQHHAALRSLIHRPRALAWYILSSLCGLRPDEAAKSSWADLLLNDSPPIIRIEAQTSKMQQRRTVYPHPTAVAWLKFAKKKGAQLPIPEQPLRRARIALKKSLHLPGRWTQSITRKTASTYWSALIQNSAEVAESLGHDVKTMKRHYRGLASQEEARQFWAITPDSILKPEAIQVDFSPSTSAKEKTQ
jgi:integrase